MTSSRTSSRARPPSAATPTPTNPSQLLYGVHNGGIPGTGNPTNNGVDPYVATRGGQTAGRPNTSASPPTTPTPRLPSPRPSPGQTTASTPSPSAAPTSARPASTTARPASRSTFLTERSPRAWPARLIPALGQTAGTVRKPLSADGSHLVFGSEQQFESGGNPDNGNATLYNRDLKSATTEVISTDTPGTDDRRRQRTSPSSTSPQTARAIGLRRPRQHRLRRQPLLPPLHARRRQPGLDRPHPEHHNRRPLRRDERRRHQGLLHQRRPADRR